MVGFKTFADKTDMEFGPGITAIVGPNGSGKSNITDALRFCLGEASVRTMRGNRMEEMIFAGSGAREPAGMAEVTLVFDNQDRYFPLDFSEVSITRRLFRGGDTEYFINKSSCRLKDIQGMLAGTGLGAGSICMLGQREMQMVLSPDTQDRKLVLDEASGVLKYKMRKREAARKLDQVKENLTRLHDIMREINSGLSAASQQVERYKKYKRNEERLRVLDIGLAATEMGAIRAQLEEVLTRGGVLGDKVQTAGARLGALEEVIHQRREEMSRTEEELQQAQEQRRLAAIELERANKEIALADERERNLERDRERIAARRSRLREQDAELAATLDRATAAVHAAHEATQRCATDVALQERALEALEAASIERSPEYRAAVTEQSALSQERSALLARAEAAATQTQRAAERAAALEAQAQRATEEGGKHEASHEEKAQEADVLRQEHEVMETRLNTLKTRRSELESSIQGFARDYEKIEDAYHQKSSRLGALHEIEDDYQGFAEGVRYLLKRAARPAGVVGVVSECVVPERAHARALEAALGGHAQDVIVETKTHAKACIELLKRERAGKVTFWPIDLERPAQRRPDIAPSPHIKNADKPPGVVGWAPDLVRYEDRYEGVVMALLGRTVIVETLDHATAIYESLVRKRAFIPMLVTLDGDILAPGGSMSGGAHKNTRAGPVQRRAELQALEHEVEDLRRRFIKVKETRRSHDDELANVRAEMENLRNSMGKHAARLAELDRAASVAQSRAESVASEVERLSSQAAAARHEADTAATEATALNQKLEALSEQAHALAARLEELRSRSEAELGERQRQTQLLEELRGRRAECMRAESEAAQEVRFISERRAELAQEACDLDNELSGQGPNPQTLQQARQKAAADVARHSEAERAAATRCVELQNRRTQMVSMLEQIEAEASTLAKTLELERGELHACEVERASLQATFEEHRLRLQELEVTTQELNAAASSIEDRAGAVAEAARLRNFLKNFGNVNLGAVDDYEALRERHDSMQTQIADLEGASASLKAMMSEMDEASVRQFAETFDKVKQHFSELYVSLFNGGKAELILTQPDNLLDTGVDIVVQPPGKRLQNLSLLSSGEKALTAIAFLLAILKARPSPFVMLDELDAPLDEQNVERVARKFQEFSEHTQFISITHNRKTMEYARVLYGVTMPDPGVSRLVAVSLEEARRDLQPHQPQPSLR
jgi:chromosome segregation protein